MDNRRYSTFLRFGEMLREARASLGLNQKETADRLGLSQSGYGEYELGHLKYTPTPETLANLGRVFGISQIELLATMGYEVGLEELGAAQVERVCESIPLATYLRLHYDLDPTRAERMAEIYELGIQTAAAAAKADRESSGRL